MEGKTQQVILHGGQGSTGELACGQDSTGELAWREHGTMELLSCASVRCFDCCAAAARVDMVVRRDCSTLRHFRFGPFLAGVGIGKLLIPNSCITSSLCRIFAARSSSYVHRRRESEALNSACFRLRDLERFSSSDSFSSGESLDGDGVPLLPDSSTLSHDPST